MINYTIESLNTIFNDDEFLNKCDDYKNNDELLELKNFINSIELNKKYFRLEMSKKRRHKKFKNINNDTNSLKEINSLLNKISDQNILKIRIKVKELLIDKDYLKEMIIESILEKCTIHTPYISLFLELIHYLYKDDKDINEIVDKLSNKLCESINSMEIKEESEYLIMCEKNKKLDKLIGYSLLITELEKNKIINGKINKTLNDFMIVLKDCDEIEEKYKCVQCLYNIFKSYYSDNLLPKEYNNKLNELIKNEKCMKIKFRMMDILERK